MTPLETKQSPLLRLKFQADVSGKTIEGYGSVAGNVDSYGDVVMAGAFTESLARHKAEGTSVKMLWQHNMATPVGRWTEMREDDIGLYVRGELNLETAAGREAAAHVKGSDVDGLSIGYRIPKGGAVTDRSNSNIVYLKTLELLEVSIVTIPANGRARIVGSKGELEQLLTKNAGLSKEAARRVAAGGWSALNPETGDHEAAELLRVLKASADRYGRR